MLKAAFWLFLTSALILQAEKPAKPLPDFGLDGLGGLSLKEKAQLMDEEMVIPSEPIILDDGKTIIAAAVIFNQPVEKVWAILSQPERQVEYLKEIKKSNLIRETSREKWVYFEIDIYGFSLHFTVKHFLYPEINSIAWELDPEAKNDLKFFHGFWRLYPWNEGKTLARYGSQVVPRFKLARVIVQSLYRSRLRRSLQAVKEYLERDQERIGLSDHRLSSK